MFLRFEMSKMFLEDQLTFRENAISFHNLTEEPHLDILLTLFFMFQSIVYSLSSY